MTAAELIRLVEQAFAGDPDDLVDAFAPDGELHDLPEEPVVVGHDALLAWFMAYGGRRDVGKVHDCFVEGGRGGLSWTVFFRSDAHAYGQHGRALLTFDEDGLISRWDGIWIERESDLSPWGGD